MHRLLAAPAALLLGACAAEPPPPPEPAKPPALIDAQMQAVERAKAVEKDVLEAQKRVDEAMEAEGG